MKKVNILLIATAFLFICSNQAIAQVGYDEDTTDNSGEHATALGSGTTASSTNATALGSGTIASGERSLAIGQNSEATNTNSVAIGRLATADGSNSFAFGSKVKASNTSSFVLGSASVGNTLVNSQTNSLMVGFNSSVPTFYVGPSGGGSHTGLVGIGTSSPSATLHVRSSAKSPNIKLSSSTDESLEIAIAASAGSFSTFSDPGDVVFRALGGGTDSDIIFSIPSLNSNRRIVFANSEKKIMTIQDTGDYGKVGIGTETFPTSLGGSDLTDYQLFVAGGILTEEVRVRTDWADYVFQSDYDLKSLSEVSEFIDTNGHLPNVPSASTVEEEGIEIGEITKIQQEKIEELTLYLIDLQKQIDALRAELE